MIYVFIVVTFIMLILVEIFTVLFRMTGVSAERARFQVISLITGAGFTTLESETIVKSGLRRRLAQIIILLGYTASLTLVAIFVNFYSEKLQTNDVYTIIAYSLIILLLVRVRYIRVIFDKLVENVADRYLRRHKKNKMHTVSHYDDSVLCELTIIEEISILEKKFIDVDFKENNIQILNIKRNSKNIVNPNGYDILKKDDTVLVFGSEENIRKMFNIF